MQRIINYPNLDYQKFDNHIYDKNNQALQHDCEEPDYLDGMPYSAKGSKVPKAPPLL